MWGGHYPIVWGRELIESKERERERWGVGLGGRHLAEQCNNQKIAGVSGGGAMEERSDLGGTCGMTPCHRSGR